jgi:hypothetical protein
MTSTASAGVHDLRGSDMSDELEPTEGSGLARRDFIKRSAIVGGMVWAAPLIQSAPAFAQTGTPQGCQDISYIAFVIHNDGTTKYKYEDLNGSCAIEGGGNLDAGCAAEYPDFDADFRDTTPGTSTDGRVSVDCSNETVWTITPTMNYGVQWVLVKSGSQNPCKLYGTTDPLQPYGAKGQAVTVDAC